jgi:hypothetical protein
LRNNAAKLVMNSMAKQREWYSNTDAGRYETLEQLSMRIEGA